MARSTGPGRQKGPRSRKSKGRTGRSPAKPSPRTASRPARNRPAEGSFRALAENAPDSIDRIDRSFRHVYVNEAGARLVGRKPHEVIGKTNRELGVPAPVAQAWEDRITRVFETGEALVVEDVFPTTDGDRFFETSCVPERDSRGRVRTVLTVSRDTTRRRRAEEELRRLEAIVDAFFAASPAILNIEDDQFRYVKTDPITPTYFGLDRESIVGRSVEELAPDFIRNFGPMMREVIETGRPRLDLEVSNPSAVTPGKTHHWRASYFPVRLPEGRRGIGVVGIDVTATKEQEAALREAHERLSAAIHAADAGTWEWVLATNENVWSDRLWSLYGLSPGSGVPSYDLWASTIHPDDRPAVEAAVNAAARDGTPLAVEWRVNQDGPPRWLASKGKPILDARGRVTRMIGVVTDVTARRAADAARAELERARAVQASEARHRSVLAAMSEGVVRQDASGAITDCNPAAERILGLTADQMAGRSSADPRWRAVHEDGSPFPGESHPAMVALRTGAPVRDVVMGVHRPDGALVWILISAEPDRAADGAVEAVVSTFLDITARKAAEEGLARSEARFRAIAEHSPVGIFQTDAAGLVVYANERGVTLTGLSREAVLGDGWRRAVHPEDAERIRQAWEGSEFGANVRTTEWRFRWPDGRVVYVRAYSSPQRDEAGKLAGSIAVVVDVTEARALREQLTVSSRLAALGTLVAGLSHEMNNPLAAALSSVAFAEEELRRRREGAGPSGAPDAGSLDDVIDALADAQEGAKRVAAIVRSLGEFSHPETGRERVLVGSVVEQVSRWLPQDVTALVDVEVQVEGADNVIASEKQLAAIVVNLVSNAAAATRPGSRGTVRIRVGPGASGMVRLEVEDDGMGMEPAVLQRIFDPFFSTRRPGKGIGLGLPVTHAIVTALGGTITAASEPGVRTTFRVELPIAGPVP